MTAHSASAFVDIWTTLPALAAARGLSARAQGAASALCARGAGGVQILFTSARLARRSARYGATPFFFEPEIVARVPDAFAALCARNADANGVALLAAPPIAELELFGRPPDRRPERIMLASFDAGDGARGALVLHEVSPALRAASGELRGWTDTLAGFFACDLRAERAAELDALARELRRETEVAGVLRVVVATLERVCGVTAQAWRRDRASWLEIATSPVGVGVAAIRFTDLPEDARGIVSLGAVTALPLIHDDAPWGALIVDAAPAVGDPVFLRAVVEHAQAGLAAAIALERHRRFVAESVALSEAGRTLFEYTRIEPLAAAVSRLATELADATAATLYLENASGDFARAGGFARAGEAEPVLPESELRAVFAAEARVVERGEGIVLVPLGEQAANGASKLLRGCLVVRRDDRAGTLPDETMRLLTAFATFGTLALRNARSFEEAAEANRALADSNAFKDDLLAMFTHDFKGPLAVISGYGELVLDRLTGEERESVGIILAQVRRLATLADDALAVARAQATGFALDRKEGDLVGFIRDLLEGSFGRLRARIEFRPALEELRCPFDPSAVRHILENIIGNALKYSEDLVRVEIRRERTEAVLRIHDRGIGIPPTEIAQVFGRFSRATNARMRGISGSGVGLYIANRLVEAHGGAIFVRSSEGVGSTFEVRLPLAIPRRARRKGDVAGAERERAANRF